MQTQKTEDQSSDVMCQELSILGKILQTLNSPSSSSEGLYLECVILEGTSGDHLVYSFCSDQGQLEKVAQQCVQLDF